MKFLAAFITFCITTVAIVYIVHSTPKATPSFSKRSAPSEVIVSASHSKTYSPSGILISLNYNARNQSKEYLIQASGESVGKLVEFASTLNIPHDSIVAQRFSLEKAWTWENNKRHPDGFEISQNIAVHLSEPQKLSKFIEGIATIADLSVSNVTPVLNDESQKRIEVYQIAIDEAKSKANALAKASGKKLGKVLFVSDGSGEGPNAYSDGVVLAAGSFARNSKMAAIPEQKIQIDASVLMKFELK